MLKELNFKGMVSYYILHDQFTLDKPWEILYINELYVQMLSVYRPIVQGTDNMADLSNYMYESKI